MKVNEIDELKLLESLSDIYICIFLYDVKNDDYHAIKTNKYLDMWAAEPVGALNKTINVIKYITMPEHLGAMMDFVDLRTLNERMNDSSNISMVFAGRINGWCKARFIAVDRDEEGNLWHALYTVECIDEEKRRENQLTYLAQTDLMTGLTNRGHGESLIREFLKNGQKGAFCLFDVDHFKSINDLYGHGVGDAVLIAIAEAMKSVKRNSDIAMRLGGDEFAMYLTDIMDEEEVDEYIQRLFDRVEMISHNIPEVREPICVSLGVAFYSESSGFDELYKKADQGVYTGKKIKGSSITFG